MATIQDILVVNTQSLVEDEGSDQISLLSILMPCLNEAETIAGCVDIAMSFLARANISGEVLIADNGSIDDSTTLATCKGARVIHVAERGYGAALRTGIIAAPGVLCYRRRQRR